MGLNVGALLTEAATIAVDVTVDEGELAAGQTVTVPLDVQIGTVSGKPLYLVASLSTTKPV
jgi:hypothetical protein